MLFGETPFYAETLLATYSNIMNHARKLEFPADVQLSPETMVSAKGCRVTVSLERMKRLTIVGPHSQAFVLCRSASGPQWRGRNQGSLSLSLLYGHTFYFVATPPYVPVVQSEIDTSHFEDVQSASTLVAFASLSDTAVLQGTPIRNILGPSFSFRRIHVYGRPQPPLQHIRYPRW
jgi:hypothetical protein